MSSKRWLLLNTMLVVGMPSIANAEFGGVTSSFAASSSHLGYNTAAASTQNNDREAASRLNSLLSNIKSIQASFDQTTKSKTTRVPTKLGQPLRSSQMGQSFKGVMQVKRPGLFRWDVQMPMKQLVVSNSSTVWVYDPDLAQATRQRMDAQMANTPALLLSGNIDAISKAFKITQPNKAADYFVLYPMDKEGMFESLSINFEGANPSKMVLVDSLGQETHIVFSQVKLNPVIASTQFKFVVPAGVDVINQ